MRNFQDTFETRKGSFVSDFSVCMTVPLNTRKKSNKLEQSTLEKTSFIRWVEIVYTSKDSLSESFSLPLM